jgi:hypothetical protein
MLDVVLLHGRAKVMQPLHFCPPPWPMVEIRRHMRHFMQ